MTFYQAIRSIQREHKSLLCVGLDTDVRKIPKFLLSHRDPVQEFNSRIIEATRDIVCAYKINLAFYEAMGECGWRTVQQTLACIPEEVVTIGDAKRGDIGNSAELYARSIMDDYNFASCTVNPYMGEDAVRPFAENRAKGAFVLAVTSNPGAKDFQYLSVNGKPLYERVIATVKKWNTKRNLGLVVGATRPSEMARVRKLVPEMPLLIPGIGAQGGDVKSTVRYGCDVRGEMAIINASRSIIYASNGEDFAEASRMAAMKLRDEINAYRAQFF
ncbi:MAG TPA: orotidine-5'-phosphate decarboxylase [Bacteroidota bacterium]|nr:orotidine-5'-phosphate decarboxylase [Bacteroidota bacterium]